MTASVISLADRRPLVRLVAESDAQAHHEALAEALRNTPHGRFNDAIERLAQTGYAATARHAREAMDRAYRFGSGVCDGKMLGVALAELVSIPTEHSAARRHANSAIRALAVIATPEHLHPEPRGAA